MSKQYEITGIGPVNAQDKDGILKLFTVLPKPFVVTQQWLSEQSKAPAMGDVLEVSDTGALTLVTEAQAIVDKTSEQPDDAGAQKKSHGSAESEAGSGTSPFKQYQAKPTVVSAAEITAVAETVDGLEFNCTFADGSEKIAHAGMTSRMAPVVGDYWVIATQPNNSPDLYEYLNPKAVFEAKYTLIEQVV